MFQGMFEKCSGFSKQGKSKLAEDLFVKSLLRQQLVVKVRE